MTEEIDLRLGRWQDALSDVEHVDAVIVDAPYSARTHGGQDAGVESWKGLQYDALSVDAVRAFVDSWAPRCAGWIVSLTDDELSLTWKRAAESADRYAFARVPWIDTTRCVRMVGDGPASSAVDICTSRPKARRFLSWGSLPGFYKGPNDRGSVVRGAKPLWLMRALVRDYTRPGDLVCDPCSGGGTTARACQLEGRRFVGAEVDPETYRAARARLAQPFTAPLFQSESAAKTGDLFDDEPST